MKTKISMIAAMDKNRVIGSKGKLPWRLPAEMNFFRKMTVGKPVIMGRKTFDSLKRPLKDRTNIILTNDRDYKVSKKCFVVHSVEDVLAIIEVHKEAVVIGGAAIYQEFLPLAEEIYLTTIHHEFAGDIYFPTFDEEEWRETHLFGRKADDKNPYDFSVSVWHRNGSR